jgi:hypothetical protein
VPSVLTSLEMGKLVELQDVNIWSLHTFMWFMQHKIVTIVIEGIITCNGGLFNTVI